MISIPRLLLTIALALTLGLVDVDRSRAQSTPHVDPRALAMGGAYVAVADGWAAINWNPAGLFVSGRRELALTYLDVPLEGGPWVDALRALGGDAGVDLPPEEAREIVDAEGAGLAGERTLGVYLASTRWGVAFQQVHYADEIGDQSTGEVVIRAASMRTREYIAAFAHATAQGRVILGGAIKYVSVETRDRTRQLDGFAAGDLDSGALLEFARDGAAGDDGVFAADFGFILIPSYRFRIGGVVRNLNAPGIDSEVASIRTLPRQIRVGAMLRAHPRLLVSSDIDVHSDPFVEGGRKRRELSAGAELTTSGLAFRGGLLIDLEAVERRPLYTFGLGVLGGSWRLDAAGTYGVDRDGLGVAGALVAEW